MLFSGQAQSTDQISKPSCPTIQRVLSERNPSNEKEDSMIRTLNDLQRNILFYGIEKVSFEKTNFNELFKF